MKKIVQGIADFIKDITLYGLEKVGLFYSQYRGFVYSTEDPKDLGRIQVNVPEVYGDGVPDVWAWPVANYAGPGYGSRILPQKNDLVWVRFEKGNPRKPLWSFGHFTIDQIPEDLTGSKKYWLRTPSGLTILIDDNNKTCTLFEKGKQIQPMVLGDTNKAKMEALIDILKSAKVNTQLGPQGFLPNFLNQLEELKSSLDETLSSNNKLS